jgi:hypothetical protein
VSSTVSSTTPTQAYLALLSWNTLGGAFKQFVEPLPRQLAKKTIRKQKAKTTRPETYPSNLRRGFDEDVIAGVMGEDDWGEQARIEALIPLQ